MNKKSKLYQIVRYNQILIVLSFLLPFCTLNYCTKKDKNTTTSESTNSQKYAETEDEGDVKQKKPLFAEQIWKELTLPESKDRARITGFWLSICAVANAFDGASIEELLLLTMSLSFLCSLVLVVLCFYENGLNLKSQLASTAAASLFLFYIIVPDELSPLVYGYWICLVLQIINVMLFSWQILKKRTTIP